MEYLEIALEKSIDGNQYKIERLISQELVRVYQIIAIEFQDRSEFDKALEFFEKCLDASKRAQDKTKEAECYQKIGLIHEKIGDLEKAIVFLNKFLELCNLIKELLESDKSQEKEKRERLISENNARIGEAHKKLAETHSKNGNIGAAIKHLERLLDIAMTSKEKSAQAEAALKLGLLHYKEGIIKKSVDYL